MFAYKLNKLIKVPQLHYDNQAKLLPVLKGEVSTNVLGTIQNSLL